ncbi:hypothetical protein BJ944DRAFT_266863 [Cunninghamella echinulata]|nr:hypothetical protein BJ944DRAFT_266863 [Cunninghamella echinulata]
MNQLPYETNINILQRISQKDVANCSRVCKNLQSFILKAPSIFYSSISIISLFQLEHFLYVAKTKIINGAPLGHYVRRLKLYINNIPRKIIESLLENLPNLEDINEFTENRSLLVELAIPKLQHLTHYYHWYTHCSQKEWIDHIHYDKAILIQLYVNDSYILSTNQSPLQQIGLRQDIKETRTPLRACDKRDISFTQDDNGNMHHYLKVLELPYLPQLTTLDLTFMWTHMYYDLDERTLESVHQQCPSLENLRLANFAMNISDGFDILLSKLKPALSLKKLELCGEIFDERSCKYLSIKYPQLITLILNFDWCHGYYWDSQPGYETFDAYGKAIHKMITSFASLTRLDLGFNENHVAMKTKYFTTSGIAFAGDCYWPNHELLQWLTFPMVPDAISTKKNPTIKHLKYPLQLMMREQRMTKKSTAPYFAHLYHPQRIFTYLTSVSLCIYGRMPKNMIFFFLDNGIREERKKIASATLKELTIEQQQLITSGKEEGEVLMTVDRKNGMKTADDFYIHDWLTIFPRLRKLTLNTNAFIKDGTKINETKDTESKLDKKQQQRLESNFNTTYLLEELNICGGGIWFKNGFTGFCRTCPNLRRIDLNNVYYALSNWKNEDMDKIFRTIPSTVFDLSHLTLDYFSLYKIHYTPWTVFDYAKQPVINTLMLKEINHNNKEDLFYGQLGNTPARSHIHLPISPTYFTEKSKVLNKDMEKIKFYHSLPLNQFCLQVICQSVDTLKFKV